MKIQPIRRQKNHRGYTLILTLIFTALAVLLLGSLGARVNNAGMLTARNNAYNSAVAAAESATEVVIAQMSRDFIHQSLSSSVSAYAGVLPGGFVSGWPATYQFTDGQGNTNQTGITCTGWQQWTNLDSQFAGLYGLVSSYQITSNARNLAGPRSVAAGVQQNIQLTSIPIFQFAIFYALDLEINPGPAMIVNGQVHGNQDMYLAPQTSLQFIDAVSASGQIYFNRSTNDQQYGSAKVMPVFDSTHLSQVSTMNLPLGVDNDPTNVVQILDEPPAGELPNSPMGAQRYYNKSDLVIITTNNAVSVLFNNYEDGTSFSTVPTNTPGGNGSSGYTFINTNASFYDYREGKQVRATQIDIAALTNWLASAGGYAFNLDAQSAMGHGINSIYIDDQRTPTASTLPAVRVVNGQFLPAGGLTIATPRPLYIFGDYNAPDLTVGSTNTASTAPASIACDAVTILSPNWNDSWNASTSLNSRNAANATVNAAFLSGIVPSVTVNGQAHYSGGVENYPRFLENWSSSTLTYNGSMVVMFQSRYGTNFWNTPGNYYNPPTRDWAFDVNFLSPSKLPPNTPQVKKLQRGSWNIVAATGN